MCLWTRLESSKTVCNTKGRSSSFKLEPQRHKNDADPASYWREILTAVRVTRDVQRVPECTDREYRTSKMVGLIGAFKAQCSNLETDALTNRQPMRMSKKS
jgi:hypothetical protein